MRVKPWLAFPFAILPAVSALAWSSFRQPILPPSQLPKKLVPTKIGPVPRFVTYHLAEVHLKDPNKYKTGNDYAGKYDVKRNYSLVFGDGPDNYEYVLRLQPGSAWPGSRAELREVFSKVHLNLVTGRGVAIGDSPQQVEQKIGRPTHQTATTFQYIYIGKRLYDATYTFRNQKLSGIQFIDTSPPRQNNSNGRFP